MRGSVISLFHRVKNPKFSSASEMLAMAQAKEASGKYGKNPAVLIVVLDRESDDYKTTYESSGLSAHQAVALLEVIKYRIMNERMKEPK